MIFETIYRWFAGLYGRDLADFLAGFKCASDGIDGGFVGANLFLGYFFWAAVSAFGIMAIYYYVINHPKFIKWWSWLIMLVVVFVINMLYGATSALNYMGDGKIDDCLVHGNMGGVSDYTCWMFGITNGIIAIILFFIFSVSFKWRSSNAKRTPF